MLALVADVPTARSYRFVNVGQCSDAIVSASRRLHGLRLPL